MNVKAQLVVGRIFFFHYAAYENGRDSGRLLQ